MTDNLNIKLTSSSKAVSASSILPFSFDNYLFENLPSFYSEIIADNDSGRLNKFLEVSEDILNTLYVKFKEIYDAIDLDDAHPRFIYRLGLLLGLSELVDLTYSTDETAIIEQRNYVKSALDKTLSKGTIGSLKVLFNSLSLIVDIEELWTKDFNTYITNPTRLERDFMLVNEYSGTHEDDYLKYCTYAYHDTYAIKKEITDSLGGPTNNVDSDDFNIPQDLMVGGDGAKLYGWNVLGSKYADTITINKSNTIFELNAESGAVSGAGIYFNNDREALGTVTAINSPVSSVYLGNYSYFMKIWNGSTVDSDVQFFTSNKFSVAKNSAYKISFAAKCEDIVSTNLVTEGDFTTSSSLSAWGSVQSTLTVVPSGNSGWSSPALNCLMLSWSAGTSGQARQQLNNLTTGKGYRFVVFVKQGDIGGALPYMVGLTDSTSAVWNNYYAGTTSSSWVPITFDFTATETNPVLVLSQIASTSGNTLFDKVAMYEIDKNATKDIKVKIIRGGEPYEDYVYNNGPTITINSKWDTFSVILTGNRTENDSRLDFFFGTDNKDVYMDNIKLERLNASTLTIDVSAVGTAVGGDAFSAPFAYKEITGNFDVETYISHNAANNYEYGALTVRSPASSAGGYQNIISERTGYSSGLYGFTRDTVNSVDTNYNHGSYHGWKRIVREGQLFYTYTKSAASADWILRTTIDRSLSGATMPDTVQVGITAFTTNTSGNLVVNTDYFKEKFGINYIKKMYSNDYGYLFLVTNNGIYYKDNYGIWFKYSSTASDFITYKDKVFILDGTTIYIYTYSDLTSPIYSISNCKYMNLLDGYLLVDSGTTIYLKDLIGYSTKSAITKPVSGTINKILNKSGSDWVVFDDNYNIFSVTDTDGTLSLPTSSYYNYSTFLPSEVDKIHFTKYTDNIFNIFFLKSGANTLRLNILFNEYVPNFGYHNIDLKFSDMISIDNNTMFGLSPSGISLYNSNTNTLLSSDIKEVEFIDLDTYNYLQFIETNDYNIGITTHKYKTTDRSNKVYILKQNINTGEYRLNDFYGIVTYDSKLIKSHFFNVLLDNSTPINSNKFDKITTLIDTIKPVYLDFLKFYLNLNSFTETLLISEVSSLIGEVMYILKYNGYMYTSSVATTATHYYNGNQKYTGYTPMSF